jgi:glycosyltransferase involved in cell wall biosynthesis
MPGSGPDTWGSTYRPDERNGVPGVGMKVCHFVASEGMGRGDAWVDLVNRLADEIEVTLVAPRDSRNFDRIDPRVERFEYRSKNTRRNPFLHVELYRIFRGMKPDIVHTHFAKASEIFHGMNRVLKIRHVATKHNPRKGKIFNRLDHVIAVSKGVAESVTHGNVEIIHNGLPNVPPSREIPREEVFTVLAVGRLEKVKAFDRLLEECAKLTFDYSLQIVGEGIERPNLERIARELRIDDKVRFLGFRRDVPERMRNADVVVLCSHSEGFSMVVIESMYYAKAMISRRVGIAAEIFPEELLIEDFHIAEKLTEVHENADSFVGRFAEFKAEYAPMFSIDRAARRHIEYYEKVLG